MSFAEAFVHSDTILAQLAEDLPQHANWTSDDIKAMLQTQKIGLLGYYPPEVRKLYVTKLLRRPI